MSNKKNQNKKFNSVSKSFPDIFEKKQNIISDILELKKINKELNEKINSFIKDEEVMNKRIDTLSKENEELKKKIKTLEQKANSQIAPPNKDSKDVSKKPEEFKDNINLNEEIKLLDIRITKIEKFMIQNHDYSTKEIQNTNKLINNCSSKSLKDFILKNNTQFLYDNFYKGEEIEKENQKIISIIEEEVYSNSSSDGNSQKKQNQTEAIFLRSIGGIARKSEKLANKIYSDIYNEFYDYCQKNKVPLSFNENFVRKKFSSWVKTFLNENEFYKYYSYDKINEIKDYLYDIKKNDEILVNLFGSMIKLFFHCLLCFPFIETKYSECNCKFEPEIMSDFLLKKIKDKKVNFCFFPGLYANGKYLLSGLIHVFTYCKTTFAFDNNIYEINKGVQNKRLDKKPEINDLNIKLQVTQQNYQNKYEIQIVPNIPIAKEDTPIYYLHQESLNTPYRSENNIFSISLKYKKEKFVGVLEIFDTQKKSEVVEIKFSSYY